MTKEREALRMALHDIERYQTKRQDFDCFENTLIKIKAALAQPAMRKTTRDEKISNPEVYEVPWTPEQEPLAYLPGVLTNFCSRCGKRLGTEADVHTCTPPNARTFDDYGNKIV